MFPVLDRVRRCHERPSRRRLVQRRIAALPPEPRLPWKKELRLRFRRKSPWTRPRVRKALPLTTPFDVKAAPVQFRWLNRPRAQGRTEAVTRRAIPVSAGLIVSLARSPSQETVATISPSSPRSLAVQRPTP